VANNTSQHILNTAANLLGFCLFVITSLHVTNYSATSYIDEFTSVIALCLISSCLLSFFSIRTADTGREKRMESIADYLFVIALVGILIIVVLVGLNFVK
jgi:hypothetical protein